MKFADEDKAAERIQRELESTKFACTALERLPRGSANYVFMGVLTTPLNDGTTQVAVKHTRNYRAAVPEMFMAPSRCLVEKETLAALSMLPPTSSNCTVRTPKLLYFNPESNIQVLEFLPGSVDLKSYMLKYFSTTTCDGSRKLVCADLGFSIGVWLRSFHQWVTLPEQKLLRNVAETNRAMQQTKYELYYERLVDAIADHPSILEPARRTFEAIRGEEAAALGNQDHLRVIHGDLWAGNIILPDAPLKDGTQVFIIDWEFCQLGSPTMDLGQMVAGLYQLYLYKDMEEARWMIEGLIHGYGYIEDKFAFRTAICIGTHMISVGSRDQGWGPETQLQQGVRIGMEMIVHAWHEDRGWFEAEDLACLFAGRDQRHFAGG